MGGDCSAVLTPKGGMSQDSITIPDPLGGTTGGAEALKNNATEVNKALASNINVKIPNVQENKNTFSKKSIEEARLKKIRTEGKVMTKGELRESFYNENELDINNTGYKNEEYSGVTIDDIFKYYNNCGIKLSKDNTTHVKFVKAIFDNLKKEWPQFIISHPYINMVSGTEEDNFKEFYENLLRSILYALIKTKKFDFYI
jgi:hypothetical protein